MAEGIRRLNLLPRQFLGEGGIRWGQMSSKNLDSSENYLGYKMDRIWWQMADYKELGQGNVVSRFLVCKKGLYPCYAIDTGDSGIVHYWGVGLWQEIEKQK